MSAAVLPRTRSLRQRPLRLWWLAVGLALLANLAVVVGLSQASRLLASEPEPPLSVRSLRQRPAEPPPPPPQTAPERPAEPTPLAVALPSLDLPAAAPDGALALPALGTLDVALDLPLHVPAFAIAAPAGGPAAAPFAAQPLAPFDRPAELVGAIDLARHYPRTARQRGTTGRSRLRLEIDAAGRVTAVSVLASEPAGVFDAAAERLGRSLSFRPAERAGQPAASVLEQVVAWELQ